MKLDQTICLFFVAVLALAQAVNGQTKSFATYYGAINNPGCGYGNPWTWVEDGYTSDGRRSGEVLTTAVSSNFYENGYGCGACFEITCVAADRNWGGGPRACTGKKVIVTVTDLCPQAGNEKWCSNSHLHMDLTPQAWDVIANSRVYGWIETSYRRVPCTPTKDGSPQSMSVFIRYESHQHWQSFCFLYVGGPGTTKGVQVSDNGGSSWQNCRHDHGCHWTHDGLLENSALSFRVTTENGQSVNMINSVPGGWLNKKGYFSLNGNFGSAGGSGGGGGQGRRVRRRVKLPANRKKGMHCGKGKWRNRPCKRRARRATSH